MNIARISDLARSRNLYPSYYEPEDRARRAESARVPPAIDIQEPLRIARGVLLDWNHLNTFITPNEKFFNVSHYRKPEVELGAW